MGSLQFIGPTARMQLRSSLHCTLPQCTCHSRRVNTHRSARRRPGAAQSAAGSCWHLHCPTALSSAPPDAPQPAVGCPVQTDPGGRKQGEVSMQAWGCRRLHAGFKFLVLMWSLMWSFHHSPAGSPAAAAQSPAPAAPRLQRHPPPGPGGAGWPAGPAPPVHWPSKGLNEGVSWSGWDSHGGMASCTLALKEYDAVASTRPRHTLPSPPPAFSMVTVASRIPVLHVEYYTFLVCSCPFGARAQHSTPLTVTACTVLDCCCRVSHVTSCLPSTKHALATHLINGQKILAYTPRRRLHMLNCGARGEEGENGGERREAAHALHHVSGVGLAVHQVGTNKHVPPSVLMAVRGPCCPCCPLPCPLGHGPTSNHVSTRSRAAA